jgi:hypothetical protein
MTILLGLLGFGLAACAAFAIGVWLGGPLLGIGLGLGALSVVSLHLARVNEPPPKRAP